MSGVAPTGNAFSVEGSRGSGLDCIELYRLEGNFTSEATFVATLSFGYPPLLRDLCGIACAERRWMVSGRLQ
jgi:hypothetical protein